VKITAETVRELAQLARLELEPADLERMQRDLDAILGYVEKLDELDTRDVPPTAHVLDVATPFRADEVTGALPVEEAVRNAPEHDRSSMIVPRVIE
jgi:aspartyl-tRNA(Asn)/glutamyl-tRNA(Gln) amidotransferase subunit C